MQARFARFSREAREVPLAAQWLGLHTFTAEGVGSVPGQGTKIPQAVQCSPPTPPRKEARKPDFLKLFLKTLF